MPNPVKKPRDIDVGVKTFRFSFGQCEMECAARLIVAFMRRDNEWQTFTREELLEFARHLSDVDKSALGMADAHPGSHVLVGVGKRLTVFEWYAHCVEDLIEHGWLTVSGETLSPTDAFIARVSGVT